MELRHAESTPYSAEDLALEEVESPKCEPLMRFSISFELINLLRKPDIDLESHSYREDYRAKLKLSMTRHNGVVFDEKSNLRLPANITTHHIIVYTHLALAMSHNLENLYALFNIAAPEPLSKDINCTNILNVWSLVDVIRRTPSSKDEKIEE